MEDLQRLLFEKGRVAKVLESLRQKGIPNRIDEPLASMLYGHALCLYGDFQQAYRVYTAIPSDPSYNAELYGGLANALFRLGDLRQARSLLQQALDMHPSASILTRIYNTFAGLHLYEGNIEEALIVIEQGMESARRETNLTALWTMEGNLGVLKMSQGLYMESYLLLRQAIDKLLSQGSIYQAANFLINLSSVTNILGESKEAQKCLKQADKFIWDTGSAQQKIILKWALGHQYQLAGFLDKALQAYGEAQSLLLDLPNPVTEVQISLAVADLFFAKVNPGSALAQVRKSRALAGEKGLRSLEKQCLCCEGKFLLRSGAIDEGMEVLNRVCRIEEGGRGDGPSGLAALYTAFGFQSLRQEEEAARWLQRALEGFERARALPALLKEREILLPLLLGLMDKLPVSNFVSSLVVQLRYPALLRRLLRRSPEGKLHCLRSLEVGDTRHYRSLLAKLQNDPNNEVRRTARLIVSNWQHHVGYRIYTLGALRVFLEGRLLTERDWKRPGTKRLFLYLLNRPDEWVPTDSILEALWPDSAAASSTKVLNTLFSYLRSTFEPWHQQGGDYVFFRSRHRAYGFFPGERSWIDFKEFTDGVRRGEDAQHARRFREARQAYRQALALYIGDFLQESPYEDWLNPQRDQLREKYFRSIIKYAILEQDSGNLAEARRVLEEALYKDPSRSECATMLIQVLTKMQLHQEAWHWGQRHLNYLKRELRIKPTPSVVEAIKRCRKAGVRNTSD